MERRYKSLILRKYNCSFNCSFVSALVTEFYVLLRNATISSSLIIGNSDIAIQPDVKVNTNA